jgi:uncharacterized RDD family membrane protein YckC
MENYPPAPPSPEQPGYSGQTPPLASQQQSYGGFLIRLTARIIDGFVVGIPIGIIFGVVFFVLSATASTSQAGQVSPAMAAALTICYLVALVAAIAYYIVLWTTGATVGMRLLHLRVVDAHNGQTIGYGRAILRFIGLIISSLPCYLGLLWVIWDSRKQGWHDKIAQTVVLRG